ncbi:hypothetical protein HAX54_033460 [Datura stramonium]|uniref:Uncharacterized protein n=1 Tax=Datura stramonium TaxID=4076 RepID=A0ABS8VD27_DATST|nr:hypothetical protein [Datura stramonium]
MAAIMERADENLLPAVYKEVSETFKAGPSDLGYLTFIRNFVQDCRQWRYLVINYDRPTVLAIGILCWSLSTGAVGASKYFMQTSMDESRGTGFGFLSLVGTVGGIGGGAIATGGLDREAKYQFNVDLDGVLDSHESGHESANVSVHCFAGSGWILTLDSHGFFTYGLAEWWMCHRIQHRWCNCDRISHMYPHSGRIMCAQFSAFMGIPFSWFLLKNCTPVCEQLLRICCDIIPDGADNQLEFYCFKWSHVCRSPPVVGILAETIYGYDAEYQ